MFGLSCSVPACTYNTDTQVPGNTALTDKIKLLEIHAKSVHQSNSNAISTNSRPTVTQSMSDQEFCFFQSEWHIYKRATRIHGQMLMDELWQCMPDKLKKEAFDRGGVASLVTENLMMERIKSVAVTAHHPSICAVKLHKSQQLEGESTKAFSARIHNIARKCRLKTSCRCGLQVSFTKETVYHVLLAGLRDRTLQKLCMDHARLNNITDMNTLVEFCTAKEKSDNIRTPTDNFESIAEGNKTKACFNIHNSETPLFNLLPDDDLNSRQAVDGSPLPKTSKNFPYHLGSAAKVPCSETSNSYMELPLENINALSSSNHVTSLEVNITEETDGSDILGSANLSLNVKEPTRKRHKKKEIERGTGGLKCKYCMATLSRKQTLQSHIQKFHSQQELCNYEQGTLHKNAVHDTGAFYGNQMDLFETPLQSSSDLQWAKSIDEKQALLNMNDEGMQFINEICLKLDD